MIQRLILILLLSMGQFYSFAQNDKIADYHVDLLVQPDRSLIVTETITVINTPVGQIQRGLTRGLPNKRMLDTKSMKMKYDIISVKLDGKVEPYSISGEGNEKMMYIGRKEVLLKPGSYVYEI